MIKQVETSVQNAKLLHDTGVGLVIPSYQRPYVWPSEAVVDLLDDILAAQDAGEPRYYIGTLLTATIQPEERGQARRIYELIDGQQRMTTFMLIAVAFRRFARQTDLANFAVLGSSPRLVFSIRKEVQALLAHWAGIADSPAPDSEIIQENPYLSSLHATLKVVTDWLEKLHKQRRVCTLEALARYLFERVVWVNNVMPASMDLNRLFATMNNRGVQLEQSDFLKSRLLKKIKEGDRRSLLEAIWQACENMDDFFERNLGRLFPAADWNSLTYDDLAGYSPERFSLNSAHREGKGLTVEQLAQQEPEPGSDSTDENKRELYCRSIISFPLLLLHVYRIYRERRGQDDIEVRLSTSRLNECFSEFVHEATEADVTEFIKCLWEVRYQFDRWVVKWLERAEDDQAHLGLSNVVRVQQGAEYRLTRSSLESSNLSQLQSVLNFTGDRSAHYWLTPFLGALVKQRIKERETAEALLEHIDNQLSLAISTQKDASFALLSGGCLEVETIESVCEDLNVPKGTGFEHYWFQKLEYLLWRKNKDKDELARRYRIVSRNSIEHVYPQNEEFKRALSSDNYLHAFGNLVLLNPSENSSYGNQSIEKKMADFNGKTNSRGHYESLKLKEMFQLMRMGRWTPEYVIERHQRAMLDLLKEHYLAEDAETARA